MVLMGSGLITLTNTMMIHGYDDEIHPLCHASFENHEDDIDSDDIDIAENNFDDIDNIDIRIGLAGFDNPMRDSKTEEVKRHIGQVRSYGVWTILWASMACKCKRHIGQVSSYCIWTIYGHIWHVNARGT